MGVPLIAGTSTLGVLAVGTTEIGKVYSDDQLKVFGDIGSLAATSLDKARLFAETNLRARQLSRAERHQPEIGDGTERRKPARTDYHQRGRNSQC